MKILHRVVDEARGIMQITSADERWYKLEDKFYPSATWILSYYPKGVQYYKWLADKGWDEAEQVKNLAGEKGSRVHRGCELLLKGEELKIDEPWVDPETGAMVEFEPEEWHAIMTFKEWYQDFKPDRIIAVEVSAVNPDIGYGGTIDLIVEKNGEIWVIDLKTSKSVWKSYELQISSYGRLLKYIPDIQSFIQNKTVRLAILQVGYTLNKHKQYKLTEVQDKFELFMHTYGIWNEEVSSKNPPQKDYPLTLSLNK